MKVILFGKTGQIGQAILTRMPNIIAYDRRLADFTQPTQLAQLILSEQPDVIINTAAYTAVDRAEAEPELADQINHLAVKTIAQTAAKINALFVHYSTDYVFDGTQPTPYLETASTNPLNTYGHSKLAGELAIQHSSCRYLILRTSWIFSTHGHNFAKTILRLAAERDELRIVADQFGAPTTAQLVAEVTCQLLTHNNPTGIYHLTAAGKTSWHGFANKLIQLAGLTTVCQAITTLDYPTPAKRPQNSCLNTEKLQQQFNIQLPHWETQLGEFI